MTPMQQDRIIRWSARATRRAAPGPAKHLATARGISRSRATRCKNGDPHAPATRNLEYIDQLARGSHTSAWPQIVEEIAVAKRAEFEGVPTGKLEARFHELVMGEHERQAKQDAALMQAALTGDYSIVPDSCLSHADVLVEIGVLAEELTERKARA